MAQISKTIGQINTHLFLTAEKNAYDTTSKNVLNYLDQAIKDSEYVINNITDTDNMFSFYEAANKAGNEISEYAYIKHIYDKQLEQENAFNMPNNALDGWEALSKNLTDSMEASPAIANARKAYSELLNKYKKDLDENVENNIKSKIHLPEGDLLDNLIEMKRARMESVITFKERLQRDLELHPYPINIPSKSEFLNGAEITLIKN